MIRCREFHSRETKAKYVRVISSNAAPKDDTKYIVGEDGKYVWLGNAYCGQHTRNMNTDSMVTIDWVESFPAGGLMAALKLWYDGHVKAYEEARAAKAKVDHEMQVRNLHQDLKMEEFTPDEDILYQAKIVLQGGPSDGKEVQTIETILKNGVALVNISHAYHRDYNPKWIDLLVVAITKAKEVASEFNAKLMQ